MVAGVLNRFRGRQDDTAVAKEKPQNRANVKYIALPVDLWEQLKELADREDRSVSWMGRKAVRELVERDQQQRGRSK